MLLDIVKQCFKLSIFSNLTRRDDENNKYDSWRIPFHHDNLVVTFELQTNRLCCFDYHSKNMRNRD